MSPLSHAEAHERLADLALEPGALDRLGPAATDPLAAHVATCDPCRRELEAWRRTAAAIEVAKGTGPDRVDLADLGGEAPVPAPPELREIVAAAASSRPVPQRARAQGAMRSVAPVPAGEPGIVSSGDGPERAGSRRAARRLLPLVAVLAVAVVGGALLVNQAGRLDESARQIALLESMTASLDRVLQDPGHTAVELRTADGASAGTIAWSSRDLVVLTTVLDVPATDRVYRCWIERDGKRSPVGLMWFAGDTAFWNGVLDEWATISLDAGGTFGVSLEPAAGPPEGNPAVLSADLGS